VRGCTLTSSAYAKQSDGERSAERCASPVHRTPPRWSSSSVHWMTRSTRQQNRQRRTWAHR